MKVPEHLQAYLARIGGTNLFGQPKFRLVWSRDRLKWNGELKYKQEARQDRFIIEVYRPPTWGGYGTREAWEAPAYAPDGRLLAGKGPFPTRGDYEYLDTVEAIDADGTRNYLLPTEAYLDTVVNLYNILVAMPEKEVQERDEAIDEAKREGDFGYILERVKEATDPKFRPIMAAFNNTAALSGSADYIARNADALLVQGTP